MRSAQLRAFSAVAAHGGFSQAARALGLTQPALTHQVRALETEHGVTLFLRQGRRVTLTPVGEELLLLTRRMRAVEDEAEALLSAVGGLEQGTLRIAADGPFHVVPMIARMQKEHPGLGFTVSVGNSEAAERRLLDVESDVAVLAQSSDDDRLYARRIGKYPIIVFVSRQHPWAKASQVPLSDLHDIRMVSRERGSATRRVFDAYCRKRGVQPRIALEIESRESVREAVAQGLGFGVISAQELGYDERIVPVGFSDAPMFTEEHVVCLADRRSDRAIRAFFAAALHPDGKLLG